MLLHERLLYISSNTRSNTPSVLWRGGVKILLVVLIGSRIQGEADVAKRELERGDSDCVYAVTRGDRKSRFNPRLGNFRGGLGGESTPKGCSGRYGKKRAGEHREDGDRAVASTGVEDSEGGRDG